MKILLVTQYFWPESFGINNLVASLQEQGAEVTVLTGQPNYPEGKIFDGYSAMKSSTSNYHGAKIVRVPILPRGKATFWRLTFNYLSFVISASMIGGWRIRGQQFDAAFVYANSPILQALPAILISKRKKVPVTLWVQDLWPESLSATGFIHSKFALKQIAKVVRYIYRSSSSILIQSEAFRAPVAELSGSPEKIQYYPNAISSPGETDSLSVIYDQVKTDLENSFSVVFAGNIGTAQSLDAILDAAETVRDKKDIQLFFFGSGSQSNWLLGEVERRSLDNVVIAGRIPPDEMNILLQSAKVLLVALRKDEIFARTIPSKIQSYMAAGRPIVASMDGEGGRIVEEAGAGLASAAGDGAALANGILELHAKSGKELNAMGAAGKAYFYENFELRRMTTRLLELLKQTAGQGATS